MTPSLVSLVGKGALDPLFERELAAVLQAIQRGDRESLHDFRVGVRRLRVLVKYFTHAEGKRRHVARKLAKLLTRSNAGRDAEVMLLWLESVWPRLDERERIGAKQWRRVLEKEQQQNVARPEQMTGEVRQVARQLERLSPASELEQIPLGLLAAQRLTEQAESLHVLMHRDAGPGDFHRLRLKVKTVRYLVLPFHDVDACRHTDKALHRLQDRLGAWHDAQVRQQRLVKSLRCEVAALERSHHAPRRAPVLPGLIALARINTASQRQMAVSIRRNYLREEGEGIAVLLRHAVAELSRAATE